MAEKRKAEDDIAPAGGDAKPKLTEATSSSAQAVVAAPAAAGVAVAGAATATAAAAGAVPDWLKKDGDKSLTAQPGGEETLSKKELKKKKAAAARVNRGNYRCSKCGEPKKGHVCAYQPMRSRASSGPRPTLFSREVQVEMDDDMTVRALRAVPPPQPIAQPAAQPAPLAPPPVPPPAAPQPPLLG